MPQIVAAHPDNLISVKDIDSKLVVDLAYRGSNNFLGRRVLGYSKWANNCYLKDEAARALSSVNTRLRALNPPMQLVMRDCWRPLKASQDMIDWTETTEAKRQKQSSLSDTQNRIFQDGRLFDSQRIFHPKNLLNLGYLASGQYSNHPKGSTVDVEVEVLNTNKNSWSKANLGTEFDTFAYESHFSADVGSYANENRELLASAMHREGFRGLATEWWHWTHSDSNGGSRYDGDVD